MPVPKGTRIGGRQKGTLNKATAEIKDLARQHAPEALAELAKLAKGAESEAARVAAIKEILDRAYGKSTQPVGQDPDFEPLVQFFSGVPRAAGQSRS